MHGINKVIKSSTDPNDAGEGYAFVFLNFKNEKRANDFFKYFYSDSNRNQAAVQNEEVTAKELMDRARPYISTKEGGVYIDPALYLIAGNIIKNYNGSGDLNEANYYEDSSTPTSGLLEEGNGIARRYMNYVTRLTAGDVTSTSNRTRFEDLSAANSTLFQL